MVLSKYKRVILKIILSVILLCIPLISQIYFKKFYYRVVGLIIVGQLFIEIFNWDQKIERMFCARWGKSRQKGFWINCIWGGVRSLIFMIVMVGLGQLFGNGLTPIDVVVALPSSAWPKILALLVVINSIIGTVGWYENEKRYRQVCYNKDKSGRLES